MSTATTSVHLVDDNEPFRRSTAWLLETAGFRVHAYASAPEFLGAATAAARAPLSGCLVSDVRMPEMSGIELQEEMQRLGVRMPLIFVTAHGDVPLAVEAMRRGASDFIEKPFDSDTLIGAVQRALAAVPADDDDGEARRKLAKLTPREREVMEYVIAGKFNKVIADILNISVKTVELHRANMMGKLGVHNVQELVRLAMRTR
jgi:two-component system response regulator FixJ